MVLYATWSAIYNTAASTINRRGEALDKAAEIIERDMVLLGATAIEDKLQEGVPDTIHTMHMAGIKVLFFGKKKTIPPVCIFVTM
jgi:phospholipid-transporting ATPase